MKRIKPFLLLSLALPIAFTGCQKSDEEEKTPSCNVASELFEVNGEVDAYSYINYDDQFRITKFVELREKNSNDTTYMADITYKGDKMTVVEGETVSSDQEKETIVYTIANGRVTTGISIDGLNVTTYTFSYNAEGYLSKIEKVSDYAPGPGEEPMSYTYSTSFKYKDGNVILKEEYDNDDELVSSETYEYYTDKKAILSGLGANSYGRFDEPNQQNLVKKIVSTYQGSSTAKDYIYTYNSDGLPVTQTTVFEGGETEKSTITYICK